MEFRYFQIIIPLLALVFIIKQVIDYRKLKASNFETILVVLFWIALTVFSIFPDLISQIIAKVFGIKNNVNAILFFGIGLLFYIQLRLYKMLRKQDGLLTEMARKMALQNPEGEERNKKPL